jgi:hypothetical protein
MGVEGPKPNMARTLFSLEALQPFLARGAAQTRFQSALRWVRQGISEGWYHEWAPSQTIDSDDHTPSITRRRDIRHTAQAAVVLCKWSPSDALIPGLIRSITCPRLDKGLWPEAPNLVTPRLLATVYAIEALGHVTAMQAGQYVSIPSAANPRVRKKSYT